MGWGPDFVNYQERAMEFSVGDSVHPWGGSKDLKGRVTAVWPAIGMVDVEFPDGDRRLPVEDLVRWEMPPKTDATPGGHPTVSVPGGPVAEHVASAYMKKAIYWAERDRKYRATLPERSGNQFFCPKCKDVPLKKAIYKRLEGASMRLFGCPSCMFLVKREDLIGCE